MTLSDYKIWLGLAQRHSRRVDEAEDLLQDALLIAAEEGRLDLEIEENRRWFSGVLRNRAAMIARSEGRRREREKGVRVSTTENRSPVDQRPPSFLQSLPPSARTLSTLILHGLTREEIQFVLQLSPTAYRQRLTTIRKALKKLPPELQAEAMALAYSRDGGKAEHLELGLIRRALLQHLRDEWGAPEPGIGTHDPDGHLIMLRFPLR